MIILEIQCIPKETKLSTNLYEKHLSLEKKTNTGFYMKLKQ